MSILADAVTKYAAERGQLLTLLADAYDRLTDPDLARHDFLLRRWLKQTEAILELTRNDGIILHRYGDASDNPGQYAADGCNRQAVTVKGLNEHPDMTAFTFDAEAEEMGLDPWRMIEGVDAARDWKTFDIWFSGERGMITVAPDFVVYVQRKDLVRLGINFGGAP